MEIGSEFWAVPICENLNTLPAGGINVLTGRMALELIALDLAAGRGVRSIYMPEYCCGSMTEPFRRLGWDIRFYGVEPGGTGIQLRFDPAHGCGAVLLMEHFGFASAAVAALAREQRARGIPVILDRVQSAFTETEAAAYADYSVISWRKWFFSCAAAAYKHCGEWLAYVDAPPDGEYVSLRRRAARLKKSYIENGSGDKGEFLALFSEAEVRLDSGLPCCAAEAKSLEELGHLDSELIRSRRRENAECLLNGLAALPRELIRPLFHELSDGDVPLFVPVLVKPELRQPLRQHLINNEVYCPIHWPAEDGRTGPLYDCELSLVCDQRYGTDDMERVIFLIKEFFHL